MDRLSVLLLAAVMSGCASSSSGPLAPAAALEECGPVHVAWTDPRHFLDLAGVPNEQAALRGDWVRKLAEHLRSRAETRLPPGERLDVTITDIKRAASPELSGGPQMDQTRVINGLSSPRIELEFARYDAQGHTLVSGQRSLTDPSNLGTAGTTRNADPLLFEKRLLSRWIDDEFSAQ